MVRVDACITANLSKPAVRNFCFELLELALGVVHSGRRVRAVKPDLAAVIAADNRLSVVKCTLNDRETEPPLRACQILPFARKR